MQGGDEMLGQLYLEATTARFEKSKLLAEKAMAQLNFEELVVNPSKESNSIATIVKHLHGNMLTMDRLFNNRW